MSALTVVHGDRSYRIHTGTPADISIPLDFYGDQPNHFAAPAASAEALDAAGFVGDTRRGGSCNCERLTLTPHCNGTHTECVGHLTRERIGVRQLLRQVLGPTVVVTLAPTAADATSERSDPSPRRGDLLITAAGLRQALGALAVPCPVGLVVRTLPNDPDKPGRRYDPEQPTPYFSMEAMEFVTTTGIQHLLVDLPSVDRLLDDGRLTTHRIFWGLPPGSHALGEARRTEASITEMIYVPPEIADGLYFLNLQIPPFQSDAAPSRPLLYPMEPS